MLPLRRQLSVIETVMLRGMDKPNADKFLASLDEPDDTTVPRRRSAKAEDDQAQLMGGWSTRG